MRCLNNRAVLRAERLDDRDVPSAVVGDFGGSGLWRWMAAGGWVQLTAANPEHIWLG